MIKIFVSGQSISGEYTPAASDSIDYLSAEFSFTPDWYGLTKTAQFSQNGKTYNVLLEKNSCILPNEIAEGTVEISVFGYLAGKAKRITTLPFSVNIRRSGFVSDGEDVVPPTPDLYSQLVACVEDAVGSVPKKLSEFEDDSGFITNEAIPEKLSAFENDTGFITTEALPQRLSQLNNDIGFVTSDDIPESLSELTADKIIGSELYVGASALTLDGGSITIQKTSYGFRVSGNRIQNVADPVDTSDAANKRYVDTLVGAISVALDGVIAAQNEFLRG